MSRALSFRTHSTHLAPVFIATGAFLFSLSACTSSQTGGEIDLNGGGGGGEVTESAGGCEEVGVEEVALDEMTAVGVTAQDIINAVEGSHESTFSWASDFEWPGGTISPEASEGTITIEVSAKPDTAVLVDLELEQSDSGRPLIEEVGPAQCRDEIRVEAEVTVTSSNGALSDTFDVTFSAADGVIVATSIPVTPGELMGSFDVDFESENVEAVQTSLELSFAFGSMSGQVAGVVQETFGSGPDSAVGGGWAVYASFPVDGCEQGLLVEPDSEWGKEFEAALLESSELALDWQGGEPSTLSVSSTIGRICYNDYGFGDANLSASLESEVSSGDARISANWDLLASAQVLPEGALGDIRVSHEFKYDDAVAPGDFEQTTGISGVVSDAEALSFSFNYEIMDGVAAGEFEIFELVIPDCARPDYMPVIVDEPGGGQSSAGCAGTDYVTIESATVASLTAE